jgi:hypothetical protein
MSSERREEKIQILKNKKITNENVQFNKNQIHFIFVHIPIFRVNHIDKDHDLFYILF